MAFNNLLTETLGITYPIIQGPFGGGLSSIELLATVSNAGGLGSYGAHHLAPEKIQHTISDIRLQTNKPFAINLWLSSHDHAIESVSRRQFEDYVALFKPVYDQVNISPPAYTEKFSESVDEQIEAAIEAAPPILSFVYGTPSAWIIDKCKAKKIKTIGTATTQQEAIVLQDAGVDAVVATGFEAGGHRVSFLKEAEHCLTGTFALIPQVADQLTIPVIAAGGIADIRGVRAAMALGADGVQVGSAFLACNESGTNDTHRETLLNIQNKNTVLTRAYTGRLARFIENDFIRQIERSNDLPLPFPIQSFFTSRLKKAAAMQKNTEFSAFYASQSCSLLTYKKAAELFQSLIVDF